MTARAANPRLAEFLAHSVELESEARERYAELADTMTAHHNRPVAAFFRRMVGEAQRHLDEVAALADGLELPELKAWEFDWPDTEPPETASYEALHYRMSLREAMNLALANERAAERYYRHVSETSGDRETSKIARQFADEEVRHAEALQRMLEAQPETGAHRREEDDEPHMPE